MKPFIQSHNVYLTPLSPIHIGCGEDFEPTNYVIDSETLFNFEPSHLMLNERERTNLLNAVNKDILAIHNFFSSNKSKIIPLSQYFSAITKGFVSEYNKNIENPAIIYTDNQTLPKIKVNNNLFTEQQKIKLGLKTNEDEILIQKYRFFQNLLSLNRVDIYSMVDSDNNIDFSAFIYEFINKYPALENNIDNLKQFFKRMSLKEKDENDFENAPFFKAYSKIKSDFKDNKLEIGAYDYMLLKKNESFFFLSKICGIKSFDEMVADIGISAKVLGIILHSALEKMFKENWKNILQSSENLLISNDVIEEYLKKIISKEELKIESFMTNYIKEVLIPRFVSNIEKFLKILYEELKGEKILRIQAEKDTKTEKKVYLKYNEIEVFLDGRADLLIETSKARYIIDFKTGGYNKEQLEFYEIMFYGSDNSLPVYSAVYNFWDEQESKNFKFENHLVENLPDKDSQFKEFLKEFLKEGFYILPKKSALKENNYDFNEYYRYKHIIPLEKMKVVEAKGDKNE